MRTAGLRTLTLVLCFVAGSAAGEPLVFSDAGLLAAVPESQLILINECEYCATDTFVGVPAGQQYTGTGGLVEIYYATPEGGLGVPPLSQPEIFADNSLFVVSQVGGFTGWTHLDFDPPTSRFDAVSSGARHAVLAVCADGSVDSVTVDNEAFSLNCPSPGIQRVRYATLGGDSEATWDQIVVPEPSSWALQGIALVTVMILSRRVRFNRTTGGRRTALPRLQR